MATISLFQTQHRTFAKVGFDREPLLRIVFTANVRYAFVNSFGIGVDSAVAGACHGLKLSNCAHGVVAHVFDD